MPLPVPEPGLVISYAYLWRSEHDQGRDEGVKDRPCAIIMTVRLASEDTVVTVLPITHRKPAQENEAVEIPPIVKARLNLDGERSWIVVGEVNRFVWPGPDLRPVSRATPDRFEFGLLPPSLFRQVRDKFLACAAAQRLRIVRRSE